MLHFRSLVPYLLALCAAPAHAAPARPDAGGELPFADGGEHDLDPIGLDDSTGRELDRAAARLDEARKRARQVVNKPTAVPGEVLTSIEAVNEVAHHVQIRLADGLAFVDVELIFASRSPAKAELSYRLPVPSEAALYALKACKRPAPAGQRRESTTQARCGEAHASAERIHNARGDALALHASAIDKSTELALQLAYVAPAPLHGGALRFRLPARGYDPRVAPSQITVDARDPELVTPGREATLDAHLPFDLRAELASAPPPRASNTRAMCGGKPCSRSYEAARNAALVTRPTWLLLDTSPSMEGPARNAADRALASLLTALPERTSLRVFAFAARASELGRFSPDAAPLKKLSDALMSDHGASTQPARVLEAHKAELAAERPRVLLLSDGKLDRAALAALAGFQRRGVELWLIALAPVGAEIGGAFSGVVQAGDLDGEALDERLHAALAPRSANGLIAGEQRVRESAPRAPYTPRAGEGWLSYWLARQRPGSLVVGGAPDGDAIVAPRYLGAPVAPRPPDTGMPKESVLSMLRTQLVPEARACLRTDRKGRADYAVSLTFHALFAEREAYEVRVEGRIPEALRGCLGEVIARLRIPAFSGRIRVRYPIHTEREPESPVIELEPEALEQVNRVISGR